MKLIKSTTAPSPEVQRALAESTQRLAEAQRVYDRAEAALHAAAQVACSVLDLGNPASSAIAS